MSADLYMSKILDLLNKVRTTQADNIKKAAQAMAGSIGVGRAVHIFGSGHSIMPMFDIFPRYGSFVGFHPIMDARLQWQNITGSGGAQELIWLERQEGYIEVMMRSHKYELDARDTMLLFSHGGMNAAAIDLAWMSKEKGLKVVAVTCVENLKINKTKHSRGKPLHDVADIVIDNCAPPDDAVIDVKGLPGPVAATSTVTMITIAQMLVAEVAGELSRMGKVPPRNFVSPNVPGVPKENNQDVFTDYDKWVNSLSS